ncbi:MAG: HisA/HisF-related TIM barrel protein, partial [Hyphomonadaceae bacterium]
MKDGRCVRLGEGRMEAASIFNDDPASQADRFQTAGFHWSHVGEWDGAIAGAP